jgi:hypothetical protein
MNAKVIGWTDAGQAERFEDEHGGQWVYFTDDAAGTVAVNACDDHGNLTDGAGVFVWQVGTDDAGTIHRKSDGDTYDVNNPGEFVVKNGEWRPAEMASV